MAYVISSKTVAGFMKAVNYALLKGDTLVGMYLSPDRRFYMAKMKEATPPKKRRGR